MTFLRLKYPGAGTENGYAGELAPVTERIVRKSTVLIAGDDGGPVFGRAVADRQKRRYGLNWLALSHAEASAIRQLWEDAGRGTLPLYYTPDDGEDPVTVLGPDAPVVNYVTQNSASVTWELVEQR